MIKKELQSLVTTLDSIFAKWIKLKHSIHGFNKCFFCNLTFSIDELDCSHFRKRRHFATRWLELNCDAACRACHSKYENMDAEYAVMIDAAKGPGTSDKLTVLSHSTFKVSRVELEILIKEYKLKIENYEKNQRN